jgi:hypothetical protein
VRADTKLRVPTFDTLTCGRPEGLGLAKVSAKSVPAQAGILITQRQKARCGKATTLKFRLGIRLFNPAQSAIKADLIIDGKNLLFIKVRGSLTPPWAVC